MVTARQIINSIKPKKIFKTQETPLGEVGYDNPRDDLEKVKKMREGSIEKVPVFANDIVNKSYVDTLTTNHPHQDVNTIASPTFQDVFLGTAEGDSYLYFYEGSSPTGSYLKWDNTDTRFKISHAFQAPNVVATATASFFCNYDGGDGDAYIYFYENTSPTGAALKWEDAGAGFEFTHRLMLRGSDNELVLGDDTKASMRLINTYASGVGRGGDLIYGINTLDSGQTSVIRGTYESFDATNKQGGDLVFGTKWAPTEARVTEKMRLKGLGYLGIGNNNASYRCDISSTNTIEDTQYFRCGTRNTNGQYGGGLLMAPNYSGYPKTSAGILGICGGNYFRMGLAFFSNNVSDGTTAMSERMRLTAAGDFGVNTTSPDTKFQVVGDCKFGDDNTNYATIGTTGNLTFTGSAEFHPPRVSASAQPTPSVGELQIWRDSDDNKTYLIYNDTDEGVRKVEMT